jgi:hypothetical protein
MRRGGACTRMVVGGCIRQHRHRGWPLRGRSDAAAWRGPASRIRRRLSPCGSPLLPFSRHGRGEAGLDLRRGGLPWCRHLLLRRATSPCRPSHASLRPPPTACPPERACSLPLPQFRCSSAAAAPSFLLPMPEPRSGGWLGMARLGTGPSRPSGTTLDLASVRLNGTVSIPFQFAGAGRKKRQIRTPVCFVAWFM